MGAGGTSLVMTMEPTCAPSSLGARTTKEREACVVPFRRITCPKFFLSTFTVDSPRSQPAGPAEVREEIRDRYEKQKACPPAMILPGFPRK